MELIASKREITGKATRRLRREGRLPAVVYGHRVASSSLQLDRREFERVFARTGKTQLIDLVVDGGRSHKVLVKEVQVSPRWNVLEHVDFHQVSLREKLQVDVPVVVVGEAEPVRMGDADVLQVQQTLRVECLPNDIPEAIEVDVSRLEHVDAGVRVSEVDLPRGVALVTDPEELVVKLAARRVTAIEEEEAAAPAEAEVAEAAASEEGGQAQEGG